VMELTRSVQAVATAGKVGELFHFAIKEPVSLPRRRSAMLPIINSPIKAERVSIYNSAVQAKHPLNGAYLVNDTGMKMLGGPVTVFDEGMYAGDARIGNLAAADKRLISYAIDLNVTVDPSAKSAGRITSAKIVRGVLNLRRLTSYKQTYAIKNKADEKRTVIIEHPFNAARKLIEPVKYEEKTPGVYRFRVPVDAVARKDFVVAEERTHLETIAILPRSAGQLVWYSKTGEISKEVRDALTKAIEMKYKLAGLESQLRELQKQLNGIKSGQDRLRRNIGTVGRDSTLGKRYLAKMSAQEDQIEELDVKIEALRKAIEEQKNALADYLKNLNVPS